MNWLDAIKVIRKHGVKPEAVVIMLIQDRIEGIDGLSEYGILTAQILPHEDIGGMDLRALVGLNVTIHDHADDPERHRKFSAAVAAIETETLVMPVYTGDDLTMHIRRGKKTETFIL